MAESTPNNDERFFKLRCPHCRHDFQEKIGRMKTGGELRCPGPGCGVTLRYEVSQFLRAMGQERRGLYDFSGDFLTPDAPPKLRH